MSSRHQLLLHWSENSDEMGSASSRIQFCASFSAIVAKTFQACKPAAEQENQSQSRCPIQEVARLLVPLLCKRQRVQRRMEKPQPKLPAPPAASVRAGSASS